MLCFNSIEIALALLSAYLKLTVVVFAKSPHQPLYSKSFCWLQNRWLGLLLRSVRSPFIYLEYWFLLVWVLAYFSVFLLSLWPACEARLCKARTLDYVPTREIFAQYPVSLSQLRLKPVTYCTTCMQLLTSYLCNLLRRTNLECRIFSSSLNLSVALYFRARMCDFSWLISSGYCVLISLLVFVEFVYSLRFFLTSGYLSMFCVLYKL